MRNKDTHDEEADSASTVNTVKTIKCEYKEAWESQTLNALKTNSRRSNQVKETEAKCQQRGYTPVINHSQSREMHYGSVFPFHVEANESQPITGE